MDQNKKEPFDAHRVIKGLSPFDTEEEIQHSLQNTDSIESLEMDYYLGLYGKQFKTNAEFINYIDDLG